MDWPTANSVPVNPATITLGGVFIAALTAIGIFFLTGEAVESSPSTPVAPAAAGAADTDATAAQTPAIDATTPQLAALTTPIQHDNSSLALEDPSEPDQPSLADWLEPMPALPASRFRRDENLTVGRGDTLMKLLTGAGIARQQAARAIKALRGHYDPRRLRIGQAVTLELTGSDGAPDELDLSELVIATGPDRSVVVERGGDGTYQAREQITETELDHVRVGGVIDASLYLAADRAGLPSQLLAELIRVYSFDVDFQREIRQGDRFEVTFERYRDTGGRLVKDGNILYAKLVLSGEPMAYYRYTPKDDRRTDYFDAKGRSVRKTLMRTPIDGARLTSGYGRRKHPTLGYNKMHRGVDFGARTGTPIMAAGDGRIVSLGRNGAYGRYIRIRHNSEYQTAYAHLSRYAKGLKPGARVRQGRIIGYVGASGRTTGPHLHYEVLRGGRQVNPMGVRLPTGRKLKGKELKRFLTNVARIDTLMAGLAVTTELAQR